MALYHPVLFAARLQNRCTLCGDLSLLVHRYAAEREYMIGGCALKSLHGTPKEVLVVVGRKSGLEGRVGVVSMGAK
jgi:hypothetical protein